MKTIVATLHFGEIPYIQYSEAINREYCRRHNYSFSVIRAPRQVERCPVWFKVRGVLELLKDCDLVLFVDGDAYFIDQGKRLEELIAEQMDGASVLMGSDRVNARWAFSDVDANCGVFLVRHTEVAFQILTEWWNAPISDDKKWLWHWPPEQGAFNRVVRPRWDAQQIKVIPYSHMNGYDGKYIRHLIGFSNYDRLRILRKEAKRLVTFAATEPAER